MGQILKKLAALAVLVAMSAVQAGPVSGQGSWETTLKARDVNGVAVALNDPGAAFFYDSVLDITWLQDWNYAFTGGYTGQGVSADGDMIKSAAVKWADELVYGGYSDWRLPTTLQADPCGTLLYDRAQCSELGRMYYDTLGNLGYCSPGGVCEQPGWGLSNTGPFINLDPARYWLGAEVFYLETQSWLVDMLNGAQAIQSKNFGDGVRGVAVRDGDVCRGGAAEGCFRGVREPASFVLVGLALLGVVITRGRKSAAPTA